MTCFAVACLAVVCLAVACFALTCFLRGELGAVCAEVGFEAERPFDRDAVSRPPREGMDLFAEWELGWPGSAARGDGSSR